MITLQERMWLYSRGGRNESDVLYDTLGRKYVLMSAGEKEKEIKVFIPYDFKFIVHSIHTKKNIYELE